MSRTWTCRGSLTAAALLLALSAQTSADTIVHSMSGPPGDAWTSSSEQQVGASSWYYEADGGGTVGIRTDFQRNGNGSLFLQTTSDSSYAQMTYSSGSSLGSLADLKALSYDWYRSSSSTVLDHFAPALAIFVSNNGGSSGRWLISEPIYNHASPYTAPTNAWTSEDAYLADVNGNGNGQFWTSISGTWTQKSIADWKTDFAGYDVYKVAGFIGAGIGNTTFTGAVDNISWRFGDAPAVTYNFEVVPEPSSVIMGVIAGGTGLVMAARRRSRRA